MFRTERYGWLRRLHGTVDAMLRLSFGKERNAQVALDRINATHGRVHGHLPEAGPLLRGELCSLWGTAPGRGSARRSESAATLQRLRMPRPHQVQPTTGLAAACTNRVDVFVRADAARLLDNTSAPCVNNLAQLLKATNRLQEAEPLSRRHVEISLDFTCRTGHPHPHLNAALANYAGILRDLRRSKAEIQAELGALLRQYKVTLGRWRCALAAARLARPALSSSGRPDSPPFRSVSFMPRRGVAHTRWSPCIVAEQEKLLAWGGKGQPKPASCRLQRPCCGPRRPNRAPRLTGRPPRPAPSFHRARSKFLLVLVDKI